MSGFEDCPIEGTFCIGMEIGDGDKILISPSTDIIMRYTFPDYDHLRLWEPREQRLKACFLGQKALAELVTMGIPESEEQETIPEDIYNLWLQVTHNVTSEEDEEEDRRIFGADGEALSDAEIDYYFKEWGLGDA